MKHKTLIIITSSFAITFLTFLIISLVLNNKVNISNEIDNIMKFLGHEGKEYFTRVKNNLKNPVDLAYFVFGLEGLPTMIKVHSSLLVFIAVMWSFLLPMLGIILGFLLSISVFLTIIEKIKRQYKYDAIKTVGKYGMYISFGIFIFIAIVGLITISLLEGQLNQLENVNKIWNSLDKNYFSSNLKNSFTYLTIIRYHFQNGLSSLLANGINEINNTYNGNVSLNLLQASLVFIVILLPISLSSLIIFSTMWAATFISTRNNGMSKFTGWLGNVRIDSKREFKSMILKNTWFWFLIITYILTMILPGLVHPYKSPTQITIAVLSIVIMPFALTPILVGWIMAINIKRFNYNKLMFNQLIILWTVTTIIQLTIWTLFREEIAAPTWLMTSWPLVLISFSTASVFGFIKWKS